MATKYKSIMANAVILFIMFWKRLFQIPDGSCKYHPTCTAYTKEALLRYPLYKAVGYILLRVLKCNPFSKGGYDPLP